MESQLIARVNLGAVLVPMTVLWLLLLMLLSSAYPCLGSDLILLESRLYQSDTVSPLSPERRNDHISRTFATLFLLLLNTARYRRNVYRYEYLVRPQFIFVLIENPNPVIK
ncbi:hypothetical protein LMH87_004496 [Akanthomyces muscarius]|uniref:Uncharacterized protein n=1 Tax=Akanthomyces muscarius TaxID=2231603 RepID=A0A9W8Q3V0_AKAMU|nr:hypothetical protein LMH87_004496 [Akanthomyces muscarius]KAJ4145655.1 hypothetical protein LMH87_004496 [Akanthomyces muscarius]